jgi:O-antigen/teichoic acid export membrane protein
VLGAVAGPAAVGIYSVAATMSEAPRLVPAALGQFLNREIALGGGRAQLRRSVSQASYAAAAVGVLVAAAGWWLIVPVFGAGFAGARPLLLILIVAEVCYAPFAVASRGLLGGGWMNAAGGLGLFGGAGTCALFLLAIPAWGSYGAAAACVLSYLGLSISSWYLITRHLSAGAREMPDATRIRSKESTAGGPAVVSAARNQRRAGAP